MKEQLDTLPSIDCRLDNFKPFDILIFTTYEMLERLLLLDLVRTILPFFLLDVVDPIEYSGKILKSSFLSF